MPNISGARLRELEEKEKRLLALQESQILTPFVEELKENLGLIAANTPFEKWGNSFILAFKAAEQKMPTSAYLYKQRLPKE